MGMSRQARQVTPQSLQLPIRLSSQIPRIYVKFYLSSQLGPLLLYRTPICLMIPL